MTYYCDYTIIYPTCKNLINDLDIYFDTKMYFKKRINKIKNKAPSKLGLLKCSSNFNNYFVIEIIYFFYFTISVRILC
jgi:hypothetical protein